MCRPSELVLDLLPPQQGEFAKEDGERVIDEHGRRVARRDVSLIKRLAAECLGTGLLVATVIMGEKLAGGSAALALIGNTLPIGAIWVVLILALGPNFRRAFQPGRFPRYGIAESIPSASFFLMQSPKSSVAVLEPWSRMAYSNSPC